MSIMIARGLALTGAISFCLLSQNPPSRSPETTRVVNSIDGSVLYKNYCAVCHGIHGKGDGPMAALLKVPPPDLTRIAQRHEGAFPREAVEKIIRGEEPRQDAHGTREMPIWGPIFSQIAWDLDLGRVRVYNLAEYIEQMQAK
ncbi:MAG TPA: cytochrome c [Bryobacteraceae bacterium]|nr:cytochrome c [Bryobacteraceae bacterium]